MLDIVRPSIARAISLDLNDREAPMTEQPAPVEHVAVSTFVERVFPGQALEHLGRTEMVDINTFGGRLTPSSLFFQTVHWAYCWHHALGLRPEVLMYLINSVVAETVRRHASDYRGLFTIEPGKRDIRVRHDELVRGGPENPWDEAIEKLEEALRQYVPSRIMHQMLPEFSTANEETQLASLIAFMDAASPYFDYHTHTLCGIPRIVLFGTATDYRRLVTAATELSRIFHKHLAIYFANLLPMLETIARTAENGQVEVEFWGQLYKHFRGSGTSRFGGWISAFLWYVHEQDWQTKTSPLVVKDRRVATWRSIGARDGIETGSTPSHLASVPFTWHYINEVSPMYFIAGVLGVDVAEGALTPVLSYGVLRASA